jgi:LPS-assembly protein
MKSKQTYASLAGFLAVFTLLTAAGCSSVPLPYEEANRGNYLYLNPFAHKPTSPAEHLRYAQALKEQGHLRSARKQFDILVKRWPDSAEAPAAQRELAELLFTRGKNKKAFEAYEDLIRKYYSRIPNYDEVLNRQYTLAVNDMERKRMRWLFGGYRAPERAVPMFESILRNAPQWERAPEMQYLIGQAYHKGGEEEMAVVAYATTEYRYPNSPFAEKAAVAKLQSYKELVDDIPYSVDIREQALLSSALFSEIYTNSQHLADAEAFRRDLRNRSAQYTYEIGEFYERVPRPAQTGSAAIYYQKTVREYGETAYAAKSAERLRVLFPAGEVLLADGSKAPILPVPAGTEISATGVAGPGLAGPVKTAPLPERTVLDENAIEITADRMEYIGDLLIGEGHVAVQQTGASLQADRVVVNSETGEIQATGNILMIREGNRWEGQELVYNYKTREGTFGESFMYFEPAYITAASTERISTNEYLMRDVMITTCSGDRPAVYARAKELRILDENKPSGVFIKAKQVTFYVGPVPVFYTPVWQRHLGYRIFSFTLGYGGRLGAFVMGRAELHPTEWLTTDTHFDLYSQRGIGLGQDFDWVTPTGGGALQLYRISDGDPHDNDDTPADIQLIDSERYRIRLIDREQIDDQTYFATKLNWVSDPDIIEDFFNDEFRNEANPENYAVVQRSADRYAASLRADRRLNDFYTTVDRIPELTYDWYRSRLGDSPFFFESENNVSFLEQLFAEIPGEPDDYRSARFDTYNRLFLPLRFKEFFNVIPRAGYRGTWYSQPADDTGDANVRNIFELGTLTSFKAYKMLTDKSGFYGEGLRHTAEPYVDYSWRAKPNLRPTDLPQFDAVDALDSQNEFRIGMRNLLQTRRAVGRLANFVDSDLYTTYRYTPPGDERVFSNLVADTEMSLSDNLFIGNDLEYNWYTHDVNPANARIKYVAEDQSEYSFSYRYLDGTRSLFTPRVKLFPNNKWSYEFSASYDGKFDEWYERKILVNHAFDCIGMGVGLKVDEDDEAQLWVQFWLNAFKKTKVDIGY